MMPSLLAQAKEEKEGKYAVRIDGFVYFLAQSFNQAHSASSMCAKPSKSKNGAKQISFLH